jgi:TonB-dependent receptor
MRYSFAVAAFTIVLGNAVVALPSDGQVLETRITLNDTDISIEKALEDIEAQAKVVFVYSKSKVVLADRIHKHFYNRPLREVLENILPDNVAYGVTNNKIVLRRTAPAIRVRRPVAFGTVQGVVKDAAGNVLPYANIMVKDMERGVIAGADGKFTLWLPAGNYTLVARYIGYDNFEATVTIVDDQTVTQDLVLREGASRLDGVTVYGKLSRGQAKALNQQKNAINVKNVVSYDQFSKYPDRNAAEALQRVPGIAISRDQGEGELVSIRGMSPRFNAVQVNGQRIPSPDPDNDRAVGLDLLQVDIMESIEVSKTLTPDMDGDAIGGTVNFNLKQAPEDPILNVIAAGGMNQQQSDFRDLGRGLQSYAAVLGKRFFNNKLGVIGSGSFYRTDRGSLLHQYTYEETDVYNTTLSQKRSNDYDVRRTRYGLMISPDYRFNDRHSIKFVANYNVYDDYEIRRKVDYYYDDDREERETRNRGEYQDHYLFQLAGEHMFTPFKLNYSFNVTRAQEDMPDRSYYRFARAVDFSGVSEADRFALGVDDNPGGDVPLYLNRVRYNDNLTRDKDVAGKVDIEVPLKSLKGESFLKFGGKYAAKDRMADQRQFTLAGLNKTAVSAAGGTFGLIDVLFDDAQITSLGEYEEDVETGDGADYTATEDVWAAYAMATIGLTDNLSVLAGARYERTENSYTAVRSDAFQGTSNFSYSNILPSAQFKYNINENTQVKAAWSTGFTRPSFTSLIPGPDVRDDDEKTILRKNDELEPSTANNIDLIFEKYTNNLGVISIGVFGKFLDNQIITRTSREEIDGQVYTVSQSVNGETARSMGVEASVVHKFINDGIPLLKWFGVNLNYTFTDSEQATDGGREVPFRSPKHMWNAGIFYENTAIGLTMTVSGVYRSAILDGIGNTALGDVYFDKEFHLDVSASKQLTKKLSFFTQLNNLTDQTEKQIFGDPSEDYARLCQTEGYGIWGSVGLRFEL